MTYAEQFTGEVCGFGVDGKTNAGILAYEQVFDLQTGELLSMKVVLDNGPHPDADRYCDAITQGLV